MYLHVILQAGIFVTGNYNWFNLLSVVLLFPVVGSGGFPPAPRVQRARVSETPESSSRSPRVSEKQAIVTYADAPSERRNGVFRRGAMDGAPSMHGPMTRSAMPATGL